MSIKDEINENWSEQNGKLERCFEFKSYTKVMSFVNAVAWQANKQNHHPDMIVSYNKCTIKLTTHDANNSLTEKDYILALAIDKLL